MAQNVLACDREQELLLAPSLREWLPDGHLAWFVIDAVAAMDLSAFYAAYRRDGQGRAAQDFGHLEPMGCAAERELAGAGSALSNSHRATR
jgi:hypothetical protein